MNNYIDYWSLRNLLNDYLNWENIRSCYLASKSFHVLSLNQILSKKAIYLGDCYCIKNGYFEELKIIVNNPTLNLDYLLGYYARDRKYISLFEYSCKFKNKDIMIFLYLSNQN